MQPVRIVQRLKSRMSSRAEAPSTHRIQGIAFDLFNAGDSLAKLLAMPLNRALAFHHPHDGATAATAFAAHRGLPLLLTRDDFAFRNEQWHQGVALSAAATGCYTRRDSRHD